MKTIAISLILAASFILAGCATGPRFTGPDPAPNDKAAVYFYYGPDAIIPKPPQDIYINGEKAVRIQPGAYYVYHANPGNLVFSDKQNPGTGSDRENELKKNTLLEFSVQAGKVYFVEWIFVAGFPKGAGTFRLREAASAMYTISECIQVGSDMKAAAQVPTAPPAAGVASVPAVTSVASVAPAESAMPKPVEAPVAVEKKHYDSILTEDCNILAETADEKGEVDSLIAFLKEQKETHDFDQIAKIEFASTDTVKLVFTWFGGRHLGTLTVVKESGAWKITSESHSI